MLNAFTVDVEDYYHVSGFADRISPQQWDAYESRVERNTHRILRLLDRHQVRATFFVLGWVAERFPDLVREIKRCGHEVGSHSYWHRLVYTMDCDEFHADLTRSRTVLEQITGEPVVAYRAPSFSITKTSLWALDILIAEGFRYDSSIFPVRHDRYGIPDAQRFPYVVDGSRGRLTEFPPSVYRVWSANIPVSGGGYFRLYPIWLTAYCLRQINQRDGKPFLFYVHPWELDPDQPRLNGSRRSRLRHYVNLSSTARKLEQLLQAFSFTSLSDALACREDSLLVRHGASVVG